MTDTVRPFRRRRSAAPTVDVESARVSVPSPSVAALLAEARRVREASEAPEPLRLAPDPEFRAAAEGLLATLIARREQFDLWDPRGQLRRTFEALRCELRRCGVS